MTVATTGFPAFAASAPTAFERGAGGRAGRIGPDDDGGVRRTRQRVADRPGPRRDVGVPGQHDGAVHDQAAPGTGIRGHERRAPAVGHHCDTTAHGHRLGGQDAGDVEELLGRVDPDDARLAHESVEHVVGPFLAPGVHRGPAALHGYDGLAPGHPPGDAAELARVAEGLEVERDDPRGVVVLPVLEKVVGRQVGLVAHRHHAGEAEPQQRRPLEQGRRQRARLAEEADRPGADVRRQRQGVQADVRRGVHDTQGPRADQAHAGASGDCHQVGRCLGGRGEEHDPPHGLRRASREGGVQCARGNRDDGEIDGIGDVLDALMGRCGPGRRLAHPHHGTGELMGHELVERGPGRIPGRALPRDHGHGRRGQEATAPSGRRRAAPGPRSPPATRRWGRG